MVHRVLLDTADIEWRINERAAAVRLARMLAHESAGGRERIVLAHHADRTCIVASFDKRDIARYVDMCGTQRLARHRLLHALAATMRPHVAFVLGCKRIHALEQCLRSFVADCAI